MNHQCHQPVPLISCLSLSYQLWDAVEGSLRCSNEDGLSGITALAFLNNRCVYNSLKLTHMLIQPLNLCFQLLDIFNCRIVAARLNGSLDFFTVEINKPLGLLQYRGELSKYVTKHITMQRSHSLLKYGNTGLQIKSCRLHFLYSEDALEDVFSCKLFFCYVISIKLFLKILKL